MRHNLYGCVAADFPIREVTQNLGAEKRRDSKGRLLQTGEVQKKDGSYIYRYFDANGVRQVLSSWRLTKSDVTPTGKKDKPPLRDQEADLQKKLLKGYQVSNNTVLDQVERFTEAKASAVTISSIHKFDYVKNLLKKYPYFSNKKVTDVRYSDVTDFFLKLQKDGLSLGTIKIVRTILRSAFNVAMMDDYIPKNPFCFKLDYLENDTSVKEALTPDQENEFLGWLKTDPTFSYLYDPVYILFNTGMRISEFCGLTVDDIDFDAHTVNIDRQLLQEKELYYINVPKTKNGIRVLPILEDVEDCFRRIIDSRAVDEEVVIDGVSGFLLYTKNGMPRTCSNWERRFQFMCKNFRMVTGKDIDITPHICRHTYCTNTARSGMNPKVLQYLMGHSDISITLNVYTHLGLDDAREEIERIAKISR